MPTENATPLSGGRDWWRGAVIYQIYPRSFADTDGDGVGDLPGIIAKLDYVAALGVDAVWLSPFFPSPMRDFGYDVSDYRGVDPMFGTMADVDRLIAAAHARGLRIIIDLVLSHSSDRHPWFVESRASRDNAKSDWYVWADAGPDGGPPNNWLSVFGGPAWTRDAHRRQYYLHNFLKEQPDLNFHNPDVRAAMLDVLRFWAGKGVDGFRLDVVNFYFHDRALRDNPPRPTDAAIATVAAANPYGEQQHLHDKTQPENLAFLEDMRRLLDEYPGTMAMGEFVADGDVVPDMADYTRAGRRLHTAYSFELLAPSFSSMRIREVIGRMERGIGDGWPSWAFSNHDVARVVSRWGFGAHAGAAAVLIALLGSLRGSICLYQGEELGLPEADVPFERLRDPYGMAFWPHYKGRDGCRTPMPWTAADGTAGFTTGTPWLPIPTEHTTHAIARQESDTKSMLNRTRRFLRWRRDVAPLRLGTLRCLDLPEPLIGIVREHEGETIVAVFNLGPETRTVPLEAAGTLAAAGAPDFTAALEGPMLRLGGFDAFFGTMR
jgi:alpha-glucosidase